MLNAKHTQNTDDAAIYFIPRVPSQTLLFQRRLVLMFYLCVLFLNSRTHSPIICMMKTSQQISIDYFLLFFCCFALILILLIIDAHRPL